MSSVHASYFAKTRARRALEDEVLTGRYERARERAPLPLRVSEIGEPRHGGATTIRGGAE